MKQKMKQIDIFGGETDFEKLPLPKIEQFNHLSKRGNYGKS